MDVGAGVPAELITLATERGRALVAGDREHAQARLRADRIGQLLAAAVLPAELASAELIEATRDADDRVSETTRYTAADGRLTTLRTRWLRRGEEWVVNEVRNLPATPPLVSGNGLSRDGLDSPYRESLRTGELRLPRCQRCGTWIWPTRPICPHCHSFAITWTLVTAAGTVYSWVRTWHPFTPEFSGHLPFVTVLAELPQAGGRRLLGALVGPDEGDPEIGQSVTGEIAPAEGPDDWPVLRWRLER